MSGDSAEDDRIDYPTVQAALEAAELNWKLGPAQHRAFDEPVTVEELKAIFDKCRRTNANRS